MVTKSNGFEFLSGKVVEVTFMFLLRGQAGGFGVWWSGFVEMKIHLLLLWRVCPASADSEGMDWDWSLLPIGNGGYWLHKATHAAHTLQKESPVLTVVTVRVLDRNVSFMTKIGISLYQPIFCILSCFACEGISCEWSLVCRFLFSMFCLDISNTRNI